jgi:hypothetical protein
MEGSLHRSVGCGQQESPGTIPVHSAKPFPTEPQSDAKLTQIDEAKAAHVMRTTSDLPGYPAFATRDMITA